ncbi:MAG: permease-like cell division protein FtsX [Myxococcota bacterium]|nr:permease-like cell division protein FtsX [Myxococcota bacterium]
MHLKTAFTRAARAMREDAKLHLVAVSSLTVAFLCLATALLGMANLGEVAEAWGRTARMSIYLEDGASADDVAQLRLLLEGLPEVTRVEHRTGADARDELAREDMAELSSLPAEVFPASLEVELGGGTAAARTAAIAERIARFEVVEDVETYQGWFEQLATLVSAGEITALALAGLVLLCVLFVVGNTIRLAIAGRQGEIEVLKLCGASDGFVRGPFLVEGAVQGFVGALMAVLLLFIAFLALRTHVDATIAGLAGVRTVFLQPAVSLSLILGGTLIGAAGSAISLRRYLAV